MQSRRHKTRLGWLQEKGYLNRWQEFYWITEKGENALQIALADIEMHKLEMIDGVIEGSHLLASNTREEEKSA